MMVPGAGTIIVPPEISPQRDGTRLDAATLRFALLGVGAMMTLGLGVVVLAYTNQNLLRRLVAALSRLLGTRLSARLTALADDGLRGFSVFESPARVAGTLGLSLLTWSLLLLSLDWMLRAFDFAYPWYAAIVIQALVIVFVIVPLTPAMIGQYHLPVMLGLLVIVPDAALPEVRAFALVAHVMGLIPIYALGIYCLVTSPVTLRELIALAREPRQ